MLSLELYTIRKYEVCIHQIDQAQFSFTEIEAKYLVCQETTTITSLLWDFNGRTSNDYDFIHLDKNRHGDDFIDLINDDIVTLDELEIPRKGKRMDNVKNGYGNKLFQLCRGNSLFLLDGRVGEDQHGCRFDI